MYLSNGVKCQQDGNGALHVVGLADHIAHESVAENVTIAFTASCSAPAPTEPA